MAAQTMPNSSNSPSSPADCVEPDFWETLGRLCGIQAHTDRIAVSLKRSTPGGRKKYILCTTAFELAIRHKMLLRYGASGQTVRAIQSSEEHASSIPGHLQPDAVPSFRENSSGGVLANSLHELVTKETWHPIPDAFHQTQIGVASSSQ